MNLSTMSYLTKKIKFWQNAYSNSALHLSYNIKILSSLRDSAVTSLYYYNERTFSKNKKAMK